MCDPLSVAGAALSAGSMIANQAAASKVAKARSSAMAAERERQARLQADTDAVNAESQGRYKDFGTKQDAKSAELGAYFNEGNTGLPAGTAADGTPTETMPSGSNNIVTQEVAKQKGAASRYGNQQGEALGKLRGFGDLLGDTSRLQARDASKVGTIGGFMKGSAGVLPLELEDANSKGAGTQSFGSILGGLGQLGMTAGLSGASDKLFGITNSQMIGPQLPGTDPNGIVKGSGSLYSIFTR